MSNYSRAVKEAAYCRQNGIEEGVSLERIQGQIDYDKPVPGNPATLARRIWATGA